jgi:ketosteroid isomerase-like protein
MSRENVDVARRSFEAWERGDIQTFLTAADPHIALENLALPEKRTYSGVDGVLAAIEEWVGAFDDFGIEIEELDDAGDDVLVVSHQRGRGKDTGALVESRFAFLLTFRDGGVVRWRIYADIEEARTALGGPA